MTANQIRGELIKLGSDFTAVAAELGVTPRAVSRVAHRDMRSKRIMQAIADALDRRPAEVFPEANHLFDSSNLPQDQAA